MPNRRLPRTDEERDTALRTAKNRKDAVPPPLVIPYTAGTITRLDAFQPAYRTKYLAVSTGKNAQTALTDLVEEAKKQGVYYVQDFIEALNRAIRRKLFLPTVRALYNTNVNDDSVPQIGTEAELTTWGANINAGETARIAAGGAPITFPSLADVNTAVGTFNTLNAQQANAKEAYDAAQEAVATDNVEADKLILKLWNETETAFDEGNKSSMRRKAREWGVVYVATPGEVLSPDEFSLTGKVTDSVSGANIADVVVRVAEPDVFVLSDNSGNYFITVLPPGTYTIQTHKAGYIDREIAGVVVTTGAITTTDIELTVGVNPAVGTVEGVVTVGAGVQAATVTVDGTTLTTNTDISGNYTLENVPEGAQIIRATEIANPANMQTQNVNVVTGNVHQVNFNL